MRLTALIPQLCACLLLNLVCHAQGISRLSTKVISPSPDAAAFAKYGTIPVNNYTGVPSIKIPLYTIKSGDLVVPIEMSYHASGVTVEEEAPWTGLGWVLNCGGVISRQVRGRDDLVSLTDGFYHRYQYSNYSYDGYPFDPTIPVSVNGNGETVTSPNYETDICLNNVDPEPDMFYFSLPGESGSFILEKQSKENSYIAGTPTTATKIDIRYDKQVNKWIVTTKDGTKYYFGAREIREIKRESHVLFPLLNDGIPSQVYEDESSMLTGGFELLNSEDVTVSSWYLERIVSVKGYDIKFIYDLYAFNNNEPANLFSKFGSAVVSFSDQESQCFNINYSGTGTTCMNAILPKKVRTPNLAITAHVYLKEIDFLNGKIEFNKSGREDIASCNSANGYLNPGTPLLLSTIGMGNSASAGPQKLDNFIVKDSRERIIKKVKFNYSYFNNEVTSGAIYYKRLKLETITECSGAKTCTPPYSFFYNEAPGLPVKYSKGIDFWGFSNGVTNNISRVPKGTYAPGDDFYNAKYCGDANRQPSLYHMAAGTLKKINYPTGGSTVFEFEPHDYSRYGASAFNYTDFVADNVLVTPRASLNSVGGSETELTQTFTITSPTACELSYSLAFIPGLYWSGGVCNAPNPFSGYSPCEPENPYPYHYIEASPYFRLENSVTHDVIREGRLTDYEYFLTTCSGCNSPLNSSHPNTYTNKMLLNLPIGDYKLTIFQHHHFNASASVSEKSFLPRSIPLNSEGVYAKIAGGLRIKSITNYDGVGVVNNKKSFKYLTDDNHYSSGRLMTFPVFHALEGLNSFTPYNVNGCSISAVEFAGKSVSMIPLGTSAQGSIVGYDKVTVTDEPANGWTDYYYDNQTEIPDGSSSFFFGGLPNIKYTSNGNLLKEAIYNVEGALLEDKTYQYEKQLAAEIPAVAFRQSLQGLYASFGGGANADISCYSTQVNRVFYHYIDRYVPQVVTDNLYYSSGTITNITESKYDVSSHLQLLGQISTDSKGKTTSKSFTYTNEAPWIDPGISVDKFIYEPVMQSVFKNDNLLTEQRNNYQVLPSGVPVISSSESHNYNSSFETDIENTRYDEHGNVLEQKDRSGIYTCYVWGYNNEYPVAKIVGDPYSEVEIAMQHEGILQEQLYEAGGMDDAVLRQLLNRLRVYLTKSFVYTYTYRPLVGITSETDQNNRTKYYQYDEFGRLALIRDQDKNILKQICYGYNGQTDNCTYYGNKELKRPFTRNNCGLGSQGSSVEYIVPENTYYSTISAEAADEMALQELEAQGQANANTYGTCSPAAYMTGATNFSCGGMHSSNGTIIAPPGFLTTVYIYAGGGSGNYTQSVTINGSGINITQSITNSSQTFTFTMPASGTVNWSGTLSCPNTSGGGGITVH